MLGRRKNTRYRILWYLVFTKLDIRIICEKNKKWSNVVPRASPAWKTLSFHTAQKSENNEVVQWCGWCNRIDSTRYRLYSCRNRLSSQNLQNSFVSHQINYGRLLLYQNDEINTNSFFREIQRYNSRSSTVCTAQNEYFRMPIIYRLLGDDDFRFRGVISPARRHCLSPSHRFIGFIYGFVSATWSPTWHQSIKEVRSEQSSFSIVKTLKTRIIDRLKFGVNIQWKWVKLHGSFLPRSLYWCSSACPRRASVLVLESELYFFQR